MDLGKIMLSEISRQRKTKTIQFHSYVESNEQIELARTLGKDSKMESRMTGEGGMVRGGGIEQGERTHGHGQQRGDCWGWEGT